MSSDQSTTVDTPETPDQPVADQPVSSQEAGTPPEADSAASTDQPPADQPVAGQSGDATADATPPAAERPADAGQTATPAAADATDASASAADQPSEFRTALMAQLTKWAGAVEGTDLFDKQFMSPAVMTNQRKDAGKAGITFTTCIAFQQKVLTDAAASQTGSTVQTNIVGTLAESRSKKIADSWHDAAVGMTDRPKGGDIYLLAFKDTPAMFSHIGYIKSIAVNSDGTETWTTVDGGQGVAGKYDKDGNQTQAGKEKIAESHRTYFPDTNLIKGEANQGGALRLLKGWVDIDKLVQPK
jgi:hypothetical protein